MHSIKDFLQKKYPVVSLSPESFYHNNFWDNCDFEKAQEISEKVIELLREENMTYTDAYAMLGYIHMDLEQRSKYLRL